MFNLSQVFSSFSVNNLQQAKDFYANIMELPVEEIHMGLLRIKLSPHHWVIMYEKNTHTPAGFTILNFPVGNIEEAVDKLTAKGIKFEQYEEPFATNEKGISSTGEGPKIAWFKDPFGNILSVLEEIETSDEINPGETPKTVPNEKA
ncbi:MAG TPA: VOC family protein [Gillisia sp.]|nr:VOC family protein [Gillisia sp.]